MLRSLEADQTRWRSRGADGCGVGDFLRLAVRRIESAGFQSTVGHRFESDLDHYAGGTFRQFHYYGVDYGTLADEPLADPDEVPRESTTHAFVGEIGVNPGKDAGGDHGHTWPELKGKDVMPKDCAYERLKALDAKGYRSVLLWGDMRGTANDDLCLSRASLESIAKFTGGRVPM